MHKNLRPIALRTIQFGLLAALVGTAIVACGGGGNNIAPTQLQANATTPWEVMTAGDIAQCNLRPSGDTNANKTALLIERQLASAGSNSNVLTLGDNAYFLGLIIGTPNAMKKPGAGLSTKRLLFQATTTMKTMEKAITSNTLVPRPIRMARAPATTALTKAAGRCLR